MAESLDDIRTKNREDSETKDAVDSNSKESASVDDGGIPECAVCLQTCVHPCRLPCGHIFCFLCIKGTVATTHPGSIRRCAMCRSEIPSDFLDKPALLRPIFPTSAIAPNLAANVSRGASNAANNTDSNLAPPSSDHEGYQWFYEGRNGWWQYDERTSLELEGAYKRGERSCELLIAGFLYVADFDGMVQLRRGDPSRRRRIKRDLASIPVKGVAGLRQRAPVTVEDDEETPVDLSCYFQQENSDERDGVLQSGRFRNQPHLIQIPPTPANTPGNTSPGVPQTLGTTNTPTVIGSAYPEASLRHVVEEMGRLRLGETRVCMRHGVSESDERQREEGNEAADEQVTANVRTSSVLWSPVSPDIASASPWVLTLSSDEDQL